ncbi:MAG: hypothetical protein AB1724_04145 [Thermodesulfobacteriota bacterium]
MPGKKLTIRPSGLVLKRKRILAWHDTNMVYIGLTLFSAGTAIFSISGIQVALNVPGYGPYIWVPKLLLGMSLVLMGPSVFRLLQRIIIELRERE